MSRDGSPSTRDHAAEVNADFPRMARVAASPEGDGPAIADEVRGALADMTNLRMLTDVELSFRDLEAHVRDGSFTMNAVFGEDGRPVWKLFAAIVLNMLLGTENEEPPNYRAFELIHKPAGDFDELRVWCEVVKPRGKTSAEIRAELESAIRSLLAEYDRDPEGSAVPVLIEALRDNLTGVMAGPRRRGT